MNNFIGYLRFKSLQYRNSYLYAMTHMQGAMSKDYFTSTRKKDEQSNTLIICSHVFHFCTLKIGISFPFFCEK
ncbi:hypothetical protein CDAR_194672 [Caerostris darwini]|uniref:Uncharacterized protein n=1 Tax=Caerostris darwini TaxID=1538125 RepID=A0AAV4X780_9ARAC|nr:hypothetical protein CDAR_194672 [Caerostris darwini]